MSLQEPVAQSEPTRQLASDFDRFPWTSHRTLFRVWVDTETIHMLAEGHMARNSIAHRVGVSREEVDRVLGPETTA